MNAGLRWGVVLAGLAAAAGVARAGTEYVNFGTTGSTMPLEVTSLSSSIKSGAQLSLFPRSALAKLPPNVPITGIEIDKLEPGAVANAGAFRIYLGNTSQSVVSTGVSLADVKASMTLVYSSTAQSVSEPAGWWTPGGFNENPFTYTNDGLLVLTEFDRTALPAVTGNTRLMFGCVDLGVTNRGVEVRSTDPLTDALVFNGGDVRSPNLRFTFTTPTAPYLIVESGRTTLASGATYSQPYAYVGATASSQKVLLRNSGGMPITFGQATISDLTGIAETPVIITAPPVTLATGVSAPFEFSIKPTAVGNISYKANLASDATGNPFSFTVSTFANSTAAPEIQVSFVDGAGRWDGKQSPNQRNQPIGTIIPFQIQVSNVGSGVLTLAAIEESAENNTVGSCTAPSSLVLSPLQDLLIDCSFTITAAGFARYGTRITHDDTGWGEFNVLVDSQGVASIGSTTTTDMAASPPVDMAGIVESTDLAGQDLATSADAGVGAPNLRVSARRSGAPFRFDLPSGETLEPGTEVSTGSDGSPFTSASVWTLELFNNGEAPLTIAAVTLLPGEGDVIPMIDLPMLPLELQTFEGLERTVTLPGTVIFPTSYTIEIETNDPDTPVFTLQVIYPLRKANKCGVLGDGTTPDWFALGLALALFAASRLRRARA